MKRLLSIATILILAGCNAGTKPTTGGTASATASATTPVATAKASATAQAPATATAAPDAADNVTLVPMSFQEYQKLVASKSGKVVVVDVWSTYCEPCMRELPGLVGLHTKYGPDKLACISLCANYIGGGKPEEELADPLAFLKLQKATFDNVFATVPDEQLYKLLGISSVPTIFVFGTDGKPAKTFEGEPKYSDVEAFVATLIK